MPFLLRMPQTLTFISAAMVLAMPIIAAEFKIDCAQTAGTFRALHGVNNGPLNDGEVVDVSRYWKEINVPSARLHDSEWPRPDIVDIHAIFPNLDADPQAPKSYTFRQTDDYIKAIIDTGSTIVYRLGESIEHGKRKYHVHPPADYDKWAAACLGIIRHYNEGWADGFKYNIQYWEVWNEPENRPAMWSGSDEDYHRLYVTAAKAIKAKYPQLKVGGPSVGHVGKVADGKYEPTKFLEGLLAACREHKAPLDFFSWHTYTNDPTEYRRKAKGIRQWLDSHGFEKTEIHLNEWNYLPDDDWSPMLGKNQGLARHKWYERMNGAEGAAFAACVLIDLQDAPVDVGNYYSGDNSPFGLFTEHGAPKKTFFAMKAFRALLDAPQRIEVAPDQSDRFAIAAGKDKDGSRVTVLISNLRGDRDAVSLNIANLPWKGATKWEAMLVDQQRDLEVIDRGKIEAGDARWSRKVAAPSILLLKLTADK